MVTIRYRTATLDNGLEIHTECDDQASSAAVGLFVRTGARDEPRELMGVSHFLEHMMFKGSATRDAHAVNEGFDRIGARSNAFTSHEMTAYHAHVLPEHLSEATKLVFDLLRPALRDKDFTAEKGVILEEIAMYADNPGWVSSDTANDVYFDGHPLGHRVLGTPESIHALSRDQTHDYFTKRYSPGSSIIVAAGRVDFDKLVSDAKSESAGWTGSKRPRDYQPVPQVRKSVTVEQVKATRAYTTYMWPACSGSDPRRYAAIICAQILGDTEGSRLFWALVEPGLAVEAVVGFHGRDGVGEMVGSVVCSEKDLDRVDKIFRRECGSLAKSFTEDDLTRAQQKIATGVAMAGESPAGRMYRLGSMMTTLGVYTPLEAELDRVNALTMDDLRQYTTDFPMDPSTCAQIVPVRSTPIKST